MPSSIRRWLWLAAVVPLLTAGWIFLKANRAATQAAAEVASERRVPFDLLDVDQPALTGVTPQPAAPDFHDIAAYDGQLYLSSAEGLTVYDGNSWHAATRRAGMELPSAELGAMTVAALHGSTRRELLIATNTAGLLRFDGSHFRQMLPQRQDLRHITALLGLRTGRVLLGTEDAGVAVYDGESVTMLDPSLAHEHVTALAGNDQDLWIGTLARGAWRLHAGQIEQIRDALPDPQVLSIATAADRAYLGTPLGVVEFRSGSKVRALAEGTFARSLAVRGESLLIGTEDEGVFEVGLAPRSHASGADPELSGEAIPGAAIQRLAILNGVSYGLTRSAVYRQSGPGWEKVSVAEKNTLTDRHVSALSTDAAGNLWVGYFDRGLDIVSAGRAASHHLEDDHLFCVNRIVGDGRSRMAVATANGLVMFDGDQARQVLGRKDGLIADHITDVAFEKNGLVVATPAGISFVDGQGVHSVYVFQGLVNNHVYALGLSAGLAGDELLAGTLGGLSILKGDTIRANYTTANSGLKHNWITALAQVGDEWFAGTYGAGVLRMDRDGAWHTFPDLRDKFVVNPNAMLLANGRVYAGSLDQGLYIYDRNSGRWRNTVAGLPSRNCTALAASGGDLYVGTDNGAVRFEERFLP